MYSLSAFFILSSRAPSGTSAVAFITPPRKHLDIIKTLDHRKYMVEDNRLFIMNEGSPAGFLLLHLLHLRYHFIFFIFFILFILFIFNLGRGQALLNQLEDLVLDLIAGDFQPLRNRPVGKESCPRLSRSQGCSPRPTHLLV